MKRHEHADLIIAWAEGAEIECLERNRAGKEFWGVSLSPRWFTGVKYRVKPKKKEPKLVPFDKDDVRGLIGKIISVNQFGDYFMINGSCKGDDTPSVLIGTEWILVGDLLEDYVFDDGSPCGKYIEE